MYVIYILKSEFHNRYYIGHTEDLDNRLERHNKGYVKSTKPYRPWTIVHIENFKTKKEAYKREMQIKSYKKGNAFLKLINRVDTQAVNEGRL